LLCTANYIILSKEKEEIESLSWQVNSLGVKWKSEFTSRMERKASCCRVLIKASFSKFNDSPSNGFWLVTVSSIIAVDHKKEINNNS